MEERRTTPARKRILALAVGVTGLLFAGAVWLWLISGGQSHRPPSDAEARAFFERLVAATQARDWDRLCALNGADFNCRKQLETAGLDTAPSERPTIVDSHLQHDLSPDEIPARILVVEGTDGRGARYHSEVGVFHDEGRLQAINAVYWAGFEVFDRARNEQRLRDADQHNRSRP